MPSVRPAGRSLLALDILGSLSIAGDRPLLVAELLGVASVAGIRPLLRLDLLGIQGELPSGGQIAGTALAYTWGTASLSAELELSGWSQATAATAATVFAELAIAGTAIAESTGNVVVEADLSISSSGTAVSSGMLSMTAALTIGGTALAQSSGEARVSTERSIAGTSFAVSTGLVTVSLESGQDPDAAAYLNAYAPSASSTFKTALNAFVGGLKTDGIWAKLDWLNVPADTAGGFARNLRNISKTLQLANSPLYTQYRGLKGDGVASHASFQEAFNAAGNLYALNSATLGIYVNQQTTSGLASLIGSSQSTRSYMRPNTTGAGEVRINDSAAMTLGSAESLTGHRTVTRTGATARAYYRDGALSMSDNGLATAIATGPAYLLRNGVTYAAERIAVSYTGAGVSEVDAANLHTRITTFLTAIGAN